MELFSGFSLKALNTFGIEATAQSYIEFEKETELVSFLKDKLSGFPDHLIIGGGSNILFVEDYLGLVIGIRTKGIAKEAENDDYVFVKAAAGEKWDHLVEYCTEKNWGGLENLSLIPGTVGAAPIQNIGAYGIEQKDCFYSLTALNKQSGIVETMFSKDCGFGYRDSIFKNHAKGKFVIISVTYKLAKHPVLNLDYGSIRQEILKEHFNLKNITIQHVRDVVIEIRKQKLPDPLFIGNAGSFFKNPTVSAELHYLLKTENPDLISFPMADGNFKLAAGWLVEHCGWKGKRIKDAGVHENQALVLVNYGLASGNEILQLAKQIQISVFEIFGVDLVMEVNVI